jgi:hypothetical protein
MIASVGDDPVKQQQLAKALFSMDPRSQQAAASARNAGIDLPPAFTNESPALQSLTMQNPIKEPLGPDAIRMNRQINQASQSSMDKIEGLGATTGSSQNLSNKVKNEMWDEMENIKRTYGPVIGEAKKRVKKDGGDVMMLNSIDAIKEIEKDLSPEIIKGNAMLSRYLKMIKEYDKPAEFMPDTTISDLSKSFSSIKGAIPSKSMNASMRSRIDAITKAFTPAKPGDPISYADFEKVRNNINKIKLSIDPKSMSIGLKDQFDSISKLPVPSTTKAGGVVKYDDLISMKDNIRTAISNKNQNFTDIEKGTLDKMYKALKADQEDALELATGNAADAKALKEANEKYAIYAKLQDQYQDLFGKIETVVSADGTQRQLRGTQSIGNDIVLGLKNPGKDDTTINTILSSLEPKYHREVLATGLMENARKTALTDVVEPDGFNFAGFAKSWNSINKNDNLMNTFRANFTPDEVKFLDDLGSTSERISRLMAMKRNTGADLKPLSKFLGADSFMRKLIFNPFSKAVGVGAGAQAGGPLGAAAVSAAMGEVADQTKTKAEEKALKSISKLLNSVPFQYTLTELANGRAPDMERFAKTPAFQEYAKATGVPATKAWLTQAMRTREDENQEVTK